VTPLERSLRRAARDLNELGHQFAVVGGLAVSTWAEPRLTRDADLAVAVADDSSAELLVAELLARGYSLLAAVEQTATGRLGTVRLVRHDDGDGVVVDLLFASSGIEREVVGDAIFTSVIPGLVLPVAAVGYLIAMKLLARDDRSRPNDADDLAGLASVITAIVSWLQGWLSCEHAARPESPGIGQAPFTFRDRARVWF
jgi:Nucleotidyl transferase AbiEii toxin, Type IV TA system